MATSAFSPNGGIPRTAAAIIPAQRFTPEQPCPICGGHHRLPQGKAERCFGFLSSDGRYAHCTRPERAGGLPLEPDSGTYAHRLDGPCGCGASHVATDRQQGQVPPRRQPVREQRHVLRDRDGAPIAVHCRTYYSDGSKSVWWEQIDGTRGLGGRKAVNLPLYGIHELNGARELVLVEGEPA